MTFKKRLGTALRNISDIQIYGYPKNEKFQPEHQIEIENKDNILLSINDIDINTSDVGIKKDKKS